MEKDLLWLEMSIQNFIIEREKKNDRKKAIWFQVQLVYQYEVIDDSAFSLITYHLIEISSS